MAVDTASLYFRAYFGVPSSMKAPDGTQVNAVKGLLDMLARLIDQYRPTHLACAWDDDWRPAWRVELVPSYKAHRVAVTPDVDAPVGAGGKGAGSGEAEQAEDALEAQVPIIRDVLAALGIPTPGVMHHEADDVLGSLAAQASMPTVVVTGDRDLFQLAHGDVRVLYVGKGVARHDVVDSAWVREKYGVTAEQYVDFAVLRGDPSDGLPGVKGIGEKSAAQLVTAYGGLDGIVAAATDQASALTGSMRSKIAAAIDYLGPAQQVVAVVTDLDLGADAFAKPAPDVERCHDLAQRWGLGGSMDRILKALTG